MSKRTLYVKKKWFNWLQERCLGSSRDDGSLVGMRRSFWGNDAFVVRCWKHLFRITEEDFRELEKTL